MRLKKGMFIEKEGSSHKIDVLMSYLSDDIAALGNQVRRIQDAASETGVAAVRRMRQRARELIQEAAVVVARAELALNPHLEDLTTADRVAGRVFGQFLEDIPSLLQSMLGDEGMAWEDVIEDAGRTPKRKARGRHGAEQALITALVATNLVEQARHVQDVDEDEDKDVLAQGSGPKIAKLLEESAVYRRTVSLIGGEYTVELDYPVNGDAMAAVYDSSKTLVYREEIEKDPDLREEEFYKLDRIVEKIDAGSFPGMGGAGEEAIEEMGKFIKEQMGGEGKVPTKRSIRELIRSGGVDVNELREEVKEATEKREKGARTISKALEPETGTGRAPINKDAQPVPEPEETSGKSAIDKRPVPEPEGGA